MAINIDNLFIRLGKLMGYARSVRVKADPLIASVQTVMNAFDTTAYRNDVSAISNLANLTSGIPSFLGVNMYGTIQNSITQHIVNTVKTEGGVYDGTIQTALKALRDAMIDNGDSLKAVATSTISVTSATNQGSGEFITNILRSPSGDGIALQELYTENISALCTSSGNSQNFGVASFAFTGLQRVIESNTQCPQGEPTVFGGSGLKNLIQSSSASIVSSTGQSGNNILTNGDFETWTSNVPRNWTIVAGTAGTQVLQGTVPARGNYNLQLVGNGSTLTRLRQQIASSSGAPYNIFAETTYSLSLLYRTASVSLSTGIVKIEIRDSTGNSVSPAITINLATMSTTDYTLVSTTFSLARGSVPTSLYLDIYSTTAIANTKQLYIDELLLTPMIELYSGGPKVIITNGTTDWNVGDSCVLSVLSDSTSGGTFIKAIQRWIHPEQKGVLLPVNVAPTIPDSYCAPV